MKCLNVVVYYDNDAEVEKYITDVASISNDMVDVAVVVNKDSNKQSENLKHRLASAGVTCCEFMKYGENVGYLDAMLRTLQTKCGYDYVILSNTDIEYEMKDFFVELSRKKYPADIGVIAPSVYSTRIRNYQNPHYLYRISKTHLQRVYVIFKFPLLGRMYLRLSGLKGKKKSSDKQESCYVYSPNGSYMIFTEKFAALIKDYHYGALLYSEESCVGELLRIHGMKCFYDSSIEVIHHESTVTERLDYRKRFALWRESIKVILDEFY